MNATTTLENQPVLPSELQMLAACSARLGADPLLNQAAGGNTSLKDENTLWVKGSGLWLRDALHRPSFVPLHLPTVRERAAAGEADVGAGAVLTAQCPAGLRPSIETSLHALMPHRVVLHVHAVSAIAWAVQPHAEQALNTVLANMRWAWIPYARPGMPLTRAVAAATTTRPVDVLLMANHGLVVGGSSIEEAEERLRTVCAALNRPLRHAPAGRETVLGALTHGTGWLLPAQPRVHALATDPLNLARAQNGVLYPDHVVFLGTSLCTAPNDLDSAALLAWLAGQRAQPEPPPCIAVPSHGVLVRDDLGEAAQEMLTCWVDVLQRLPSTPEPVYLDATEVDTLADWEAEKFRRQQTR